jgi:D-xylose transport system substrate-binding protein
MSVSPTRLVGLGIAVSALALSLVACGSDDKSATAGGGDSKSGKIALLLPESKTTRYEALDRPLFTEALKAECASCELIYSNADQDAAKQQTQAEAALTQGAKVLVLDPVDGKAAAGVVAAAKAQNVPVIAYDRFIEGANYYVSFENEAVGKLQAQTLVDALKAAGKTSGNIAEINGSPTDPNAADFKAGAHSVLDGKVNIGKEFDTPDWSPDQAQQEMDQAITAIGRDRVIGVYVANDGMAGGIVAAMKGSGFVTPLPPVTGQDAELAGIQRIVGGDQFMTVFKSIKPEADIAGQMAIDAATSQNFTAQPTVTRNNGTKDVASVLLVPVAVTKSNIKDTVIKEGFYTAAQICARPFAQPCAAAGIA